MKLLTVGTGSGGGAGMKGGGVQLDDCCPAEGEFDRVVAVGDGDGPAPTKAAAKSAADDGTLRGGSTDGEMGWHACAGNCLLSEGRLKESFGEDGLGDSMRGLGDAMRGVPCGDCCVRSFCVGEPMGCCAGLQPLRGDATPGTVLFCEYLKELVAFDTCAGPGADCDGLIDLFGDLKSRGVIPRAGDCRGLPKGDPARLLGADTDPTRVRSALPTSMPGRSLL